MLGPVTILQNVAVISWMQNTPVVGACDGWGAWGTTDPLPSLPDGSWPFDIASGAAAGAGAETRQKTGPLTDAATDPRLFISCSISCLGRARLSTCHAQQGNRGTLAFVPRQRGERGCRMRRLAVPGRLHIMLA